MITRFDTIHERDRQQDGQTDGRTDGHRTMALAALIHSIERQKSKVVVGYSIYHFIISPTPIRQDTVKSTNATHRAPTPNRAMCPVSSFR